MRNRLSTDNEYAKNYRTWIELDKAAFNHNIAQLRTITGATTDLGIVVKANAYGHGSVPIARLCQENSHISWLFTADIPEAVLLRAQGITKNILVMGHIGGDLRPLIDYDIACAVSNYQTAVMLSSYAHQHRKKIAVHIKIDTGMCRYGFIPHQQGNFITVPSLRRILNLPFLIITGIFTHLSDTNALDYSFTNRQLTLFDASISYVEQLLHKRLYRHALASGALHTACKYDCVRVGSNVYGYWKSALQKQRITTIYPLTDFIPVLQWKTRISDIKYIQVGDSVGYQRTFIADKTMKVAIIPVGYYDGYPRALSHKGSVLINSIIAPILGLISMNNMVVDVTPISKIAINDEVLLCGRHNAINAEHKADLIDSIPNEFLTRICPSIPRYIC